ncbi:MAG: hypothetical protein ACE15E_03355 [Acidobacteriota bacterium]
MTINLTRNHAIIIGVLVAVLVLGVWVLSRDTRDPEWLRDKYGINNAFTQKIDTPDGTVTASLVPVNLADGRTAYLVVPQKGDEPLYLKDENGLAPRESGSRLMPRGPPLYLKDENGLAPVQTTDQSIDKERFVRSRPVIVERPVTRSESTRVEPKKRRSTRDEVLIVAGGAGTGAAVGGLAGGKKGAAIGAISGGVAGLVYDLATRNK